MQHHVMTAESDAARFEVQHSFILATSSSQEKL
jgi:hypothetical protein